MIRACFVARAGAGSADVVREGSGVTPGARIVAVRPRAAAVPARTPVFLVDFLFVMCPLREMRRDLRRHRHGPAVGLWPAGWGSPVRQNDRPGDTHSNAPKTPEVQSDSCESS